MLAGLGFMDPIYLLIHNLPISGEHSRIHFQISQNSMIYMLTEAVSILRSNVTFYVHLTSTN